MKIKFPKLNINQALLIQLYLILILFPILILSITSFGESFFLISFLKYINCFVFAWIFLSTLWIGKKIYHPYSLFLISFFSFLISRVQVSTPVVSRKAQEGYLFSTEVYYKIFVVKKIYKMFLCQIFGIRLENEKKDKIIYIL